MNGKRKKKIPLKDESTHAQGLAGLLEVLAHALDVVGGEHVAPALLELADGALLLVVEEAAEDLVEDLEVGGGGAELAVELDDHLGGEPLPAPGALRQARLQRPHDPARVHELVGQVVELVRVLLHRPQVLEHVDRDLVAEHRRLVAQAEHRVRRPGGCHCCCLLCVE